MEAGCIAHAGVLVEVFGRRRHRRVTGYSKLRVAATVSAPTIRL